MNNLKDILLKQFSNPFGYAKHLYHNGILQKQSYSAVLTITHAKYAGEALVHLLLEELIHPQTYDKFKDYSKVNLHKYYDLLSSMGTYYSDIMY